MLGAISRLALVIALVVAFIALLGVRGSTRMTWPTSSCDTIDYGRVARPPFPAKFEMTDRPFCGD